MYFEREDNRLVTASRRIIMQVTLRFFFGARIPSSELMMAGIETRLRG